MYARMKLDIGPLDLVHACLVRFAPGGSRRARERIEARWGGPERALACLSVRSALDLYLTALALPAGSEVLVSALTIRGMLDVLSAHGLVAVPLELEPGTVLPSATGLRAAAGPRARLVLVAHLFGARGELDELAVEAHRLGLPLIEDCAQAWLGDEYAGHAGAAVALFSFGLIKTATALGGAVAVVKDPGVLAEMRARERGWPVQSRAVFARRLRTALLFTGLARPMFYAPFVRWCSRTGRDLDALLHGSVRGFAPAELMAQLRQRPSAPMLRLLARRLRRDAPERIAPRRAAGERLAGALRAHLPTGERALLAGEGALPGEATAPHGHWVFPVLVTDPSALVSALRAADFDATRVSSLVAVEPPADRPQLASSYARELLERVVFLPAGAHVPDAELDRQAELVRRALGPG